MKKLLLFLFTVLCITTGHSQAGKLWSTVTSTDNISVSKSALRQGFPQDFKLFKLNLQSFREVLFTAPQKNSNANGAIISLPNVAGKMEQFEIFESSNFDAELQAQFPEIRSYVGIGKDDRNAQIRISAAPTGIQTMIFRTDKSNEFMEPYNSDATIYAIYNSSRIKGQLPFTCSTVDVELFDANKSVISQLSNTSQLKTFRLALSCTAEYANYFGATSASGFNLVLAAFNATMTRVNGVFEKDFACHMNLIANESSIVYYNAATDPYSDSSNMGNWNSELQANLTATITEATYDIGHLFGATGGGGNAGCIGCVCVNGSKGSGITSPADGIPMGDNFDIDYVAHEMGHQFGGNHTFSHTAENNAVNVEPGSASTIMGYAGITGPTTDVQAHSDDYFAYRSILQVQTNLIGKTCPVTTALSNLAPVMNAGADYTIPKSTPFKLVGTGTDPNGNVISYCWEENDDATTVGATASLPSPTKTNGPNFRSFNPVSNGVRYFPKLASVVAGTNSTTWETLSSVARTLNFTLTGRDNVAGAGQTGTDAMVVTVSATTGPFDVTSQSSAETWQIGETKTITWAVNGASALPGSANVDIFLSTDGGLTFPTVLASGVPNNGTASVTVPNVASQTCRVMVKPTGNIYYDINTTNFLIGYTVTTSCTTYNYNTPFTVPDGVNSYTQKTINVPTSSTISDVNITINATHPNIQNLVMVLSKSGVALQNLYVNNCASGVNFNVTFDSQAPAFVCGNPTQGTYALPTSSSLNIYNGINQSGNWNFGFKDTVIGNVGTINSIALEICSQTTALTLANENFNFENFALSPNPNNGSFNIKFNSNTENEIGVAVYDMRGREIFTKKYSNNGAFDQNISLDTVQTGVYLVNIQDGDKKIVKKIVVQ